MPLSLSHPDVPSTTNRPAPTPSAVGSYRRLAWAGVELRWGAHRILIDPLEDTARLASRLGSPRGPVLVAEPLARGTTDVLLTHAHLDHFDPAAIARHLGGAGRVWCPADAAGEVAATGLPVTGVEVGEQHRVGPFDVWPSFAADWHGDPQLSWVVGSPAARVIHSGDTIWHGHWWEIARRHGPFAVAFLPINGFLAAFADSTAARVPGSLTPHQAVEAAHVLGARAVCPIHYGLFDNPPHYVEFPQPLAAVREAAAVRGLVVAESAGAVAW